MVSKSCIAPWRVGPEPAAVALGTQVPTWAASCATTPDGWHRRPGPPAGRLDAAPADVQRPPAAASPAAVSGHELPVLPSARQCSHPFEEALEMGRSWIDTSAPADPAVHLGTSSRCPRASHIGGIVASSGGPRLRLGLLGQLVILTEAFWAKHTAPCQCGCRPYERC